jgi:hypothetical protein
MKDTWYVEKNDSLLKLLFYCVTVRKKLLERNSLNQESTSTDSARELEYIIAIISFILLSFEENIR